MKDRIICLYLKLGRPYIVAKLLKPLLKSKPIAEEPQPKLKILHKKDIRPWKKPLGEYLEGTSYMRKDKSK